MKNTSRYTFTCDNIRNTSRISSQLLLQRYIFVPSSSKLPSNKTAIKKVEALAEKYTLLDSLLFKIVSNPDKEATVLAIPEICTDKIITLYH